MLNTKSPLLSDLQDFHYLKRGYSPHIFSFQFRQNSGIQWPKGRDVVEMLLRGAPGHKPVKRKKALLVGIATSGPDDISTLLRTLGWTCTAVSGHANVLAAIERQAFDAIVLDLTRASERVEQTILGICELRPSLSERIVAISRGKVDTETIELIERYHLPYLAEENIVSRLWNTLEELVVSPRSRIGNLRMARLIFDSALVPLPAGVRSTNVSGRHLTYEHDDTMIDILVDVRAGSRRMSLVGQVLDPPRTEGKEGSIPVVLSGTAGTLARTTTNPWGEFHLEFEPEETLNLEIRLAGPCWACIPLRHVLWTKLKMPDRETGT